MERGPAPGYHRPEEVLASKGTIRFQPEKPLPAALVRKLVKTRIAENAARRKESR
jgi:uncharacterized protein YdhG (YjbR/CyaY superfamily)